MSGADETLGRAEIEGAKAFADGIDRRDCPYRHHPEPRLATAWVTGWVRGLLDVMRPVGETAEPDPSPGP